MAEFIVGYEPSSATEGSDWATGNDGGTRTLAYRPASSTPAVDVTPLPSGQYLYQVGVVLDVQSGQDTSIPIGIYEIVSNSQKDLLYSTSILVKASEGTGFRILTTTLSVDASAWSGKRLGVARTRTLDTVSNGIKYHSGLGSPSAFYQTGIGTSTTLPTNWTDAGTAFVESIWAIFNDSPSGANIWRRFPSSFLRNPSNFIPFPNDYVSTIANGFFEQPVNTGITGNLSLSEASDTVSSSGALSISAGSSITESQDSVASTGQASIAAVLSLTEANDSLSSDGTIASSGITGSLSVTETNDTASSAASVSLAAALSITESADTVSASSALSSSGLLSLTEANDSISASGLLSVAASLSKTEDADILSAIASIASSSITGNLSLTEANDSVSSTGSLSLVASSAITEINDQISSAGVVSITSIFSATDENDLIISYGALSVAANLSITEANDSLYSEGIIPLDSYPDVSRIIYIQAESYRVTIPAIDYTLTVEPEQTRIIVQ
jgi:hypothetical protein